MLLSVILSIEVGFLPIVNDYVRAQSRCLRLFNFGLENFVELHVFNNESKRTNYKRSSDSTYSNNQ